MRLESKTLAITIILLTALLYIVASCTSRDARLGKLDSIDSLMELNPQAAYDSLCNSKEQMTANNPKEISMRYRLLMAKAQNKLYLQMPSDFLFQDVVNYYNANGTINEKMEARYLYGCIYRDLKNEAKAMFYFQEAANIADTLSRTCNYSILFRIYGQIGDLYKSLYLRHEAILAYQKSSHYALKANDKQAWIQGMVQTATVYYTLGDTTKAIKISNQCEQLYRKEKMPQEAIRVLPRRIYFLLERHQYNKAKHLMETYECESGLFDKNGCIQQGREHYYKAKGLYYLGINRIDSAECYFHKLNKAGHIQEALNGLLTVYAKLCLKDSILKYSALCEKENDRAINSIQSEATQQVYNLQNNLILQKDIQRNKLQATIWKIIVISVCVLFLLIGLCLFFIYREQETKRLQKIKILNAAYSQCQKQLAQAISDYNIAQTNNIALIEEKQKQITSLQEKIKKLKILQNRVNKKDMQNVFRKSEIASVFKQKASPKMGTPKPSDLEWQVLEDSFAESFPRLYDKMVQAKLSRQELQVCLLILLQFDNSTMAVLMLTNTNVICNVKKRNNEKLFGEASATSLAKNLIESC